MLARSNENPKGRLGLHHKGLKFALVFLFAVLLFSGFNQQFPGAATWLREQITVDNTVAQSDKLVTFLESQGFPREFIVLEGIPFLSKVNPDLVATTRSRLLTLSFYTLTRVDITDPRSFFSIQLPVPGLQNLAAYNPADPEQEGPIIEVVEEPGPPPSPGPPGPALAALYTSHNSESYSGDGGRDHESGNGEISQVSIALASDLEQAGIPTVRSDKIHDTPVLEQAYSQSVKTATQLIKANPKLQVILDVHRDGLPDGKSKRVVTVNGKPATPVMIVLGTKHANWQKNEEFAKELVAKANAKYPGLFLPIYYATDARYNQHLHPQALLVEFGDQYNTTEEAKNAAAAVATVLADIIKNKN